MVYETLHESVVYWKILRKLPKRDSKQTRQERENHSSSPTKAIEEAKEKVQSNPETKQR